LIHRYGVSPETLIMLCSLYRNFSKGYSVDIVLNGIRGGSNIDIKLYKGPSSEYVLESVPKYTHQTLVSLLHVSARNRCLKIR